MRRLERKCEDSQREIERRGSTTERFNFVGDREGFTCEPRPRCKVATPRVSVAATAAVSVSTIPFSLAPAPRA